MDFPMLEVCADELSQAWAEKYFHDNGLKCPRCGASKGNAWIEGKTRCSGLTKYRCRQCHQPYTVYQGTVFAHKQIRPAQAILLLRGICKGESSAGLARELGMKYDRVLTLRRAIQANAQTAQSDQALNDGVTETDEMFQNAGEKGRKAR